MKITILGFFAALAALFSTPDSGDHVLTDLWKKYDVASKADLPKQQLQVLEDIKKRALEQRLMWDYYDACLASRDVTADLNWKLRDSADTAFRNEVGKYGDASLGFFYRYEQASSGLWEFVRDNAAALRKAHTEAFTSRIVWSQMPYSEGRLQAFLCGHIRDDYEFALWTVWLRTSSDAQSDVEAALRDCVAGDAMKLAIIDFLKIYRFTSPYSSENAYRKYVDAHAGEAASFLARQELLSIRLRSLENGEKGSSQDYRDLRKACTDFLDEVRRLSGDDRKLAECCVRPTSIIKELDASTLSFSIDDSKVEIVVRNVSRVDFSLRQSGKVKFSTTVKNQAGSYHRRDTLRLDLPASLDDGSYEAVCDYGGQDKTSTRPYLRYTLSLALRDSDAGRCIYVADFKTGEPVYKVDLSMKANGEQVAALPSFALVGFTPLPDSFVSKASSERKSYGICCSMKAADGRLRMSKEQYFSGRYQPSAGYTDASYATLLTDCGAYNPGDVAHFKAIVYKGNPKDGYKVCAAGEKVRVSLYDAEYKLVSQLSLRTGEYGSVAGEFSLPADRKGGQWRIEASCGEADASRRIIVDEYVLPTFDLVFDPEESFAFVGDEIKVSGHVKAYSGHSLSGAKIRWEVTGDVDGEMSSEARIGDGGRFSFSFKAGKADDRYSKWFNVNVTVTDATGETREFSTSRYASSGGIDVGARLEETLEGSYRCVVGSGYSELGIIDADARLRFSTRTQNGVNVPLDVSYEIFRGPVAGSRKVASGTVVSGEELLLDLSGYESGIFTVAARVQTTDQNGKVRKGESWFTFLKVSDNARTLDEPLSGYHRRMAGDGIRFQIGDATAPLWAVIQLWGADNHVLRAQTLHLAGAQGKPGSLTEIDWEYLDSYPDKVVLSVFYFRDGMSTQYTLDYFRPVSKYVLPMSFSRFTDEAGPGSQVEIGFRTSADAECAATVFDKSTETIQGNVWSPVGLRFAIPSAPYVSTVCGSDGIEEPRIYYSMADKAATKGGMRLKAAVGANMVLEESMVESMESASCDDLVAEAAEVAVRSDFKAALAFEPSIRPDKEGNAVLNFRTSDRLSSYIVQLFAHDKAMNSAAMRQEMLVTMPVKVSVMEPGYLFQGDRYVLNASVSSAAKTDVSGDAVLQVYDAGTYSRTKDMEPLLTLTSKVPHIAPGDNVQLSFDLSEVLRSNVGKDYFGKKPATSPMPDTLGIRLTFVGRTDDVDASDAVFVAVPVHPAFQTLTEAHSAVLSAGMDREKLISDLRSMFVNVAGDDAQLREISILDMVREALPSLQDPQVDNLLSLLDAWYSNALSASLDGPSGVDTLASVQGNLVKKILECRNSDGGFAWFKDMDSSPMMTALLLQRFAGARDRGLLDVTSSLADGLNCADVVAAAVRYLDRQQFEGTGRRPYWCGGISMEQYLYVRSLYADVRLDVRPNRAFRKEASAYLVPKKARGLNGAIHAKSRRLLTLVNLLGSQDGIKLASSLGVKLSAGSKLISSVRADYASLFEYAQPHRNGGRYYPNAVMPFRGLMESEAYAHSLLCNLFALPANSSSETLAKAVPASSAAEYAALADDIRLWLMLQKETQEWNSDPAYVEALASVLDGSESVLSTKVIALSMTYSKPFRLIKAAGNGFSLSREYALITEGGDTRLLKDGDVLHVGDKVVASYRIWNEENRSYVRVRVPRPACLRPVNQISGRYGWWLSPLRVAGWYSCTPQGYRWVRSDATEYWFDSYPEEKTTITETFFVTQEGSFTSPVAEIESLYAPHYRANAGYDGMMFISK